MAAEKTLKARQIQKNDIRANWDKATNFIPKLGELILYTDENRIKIGDGSTTIANLPYLTEQPQVIIKTWTAADFA